jgi:hypothetical protein
MLGLSFWIFLQLLVVILRLSICFRRCNVEWNVVDGCLVLVVRLMSLWHKGMTNEARTGTIQMRRHNLMYLSTYNTGMQ